MMSVQPIKFSGKKWVHWKKITIKQIESSSYAEFSEENENDFCQVAYLRETKLYVVLEFSIVFLLTGTNRPA